MVLRSLSRGSAWGFIGLLALAILATILIGEITRWIGRSIIMPYPVVLELLAWTGIMCTYVGFAPAELLLGPRKGLARLVDQDWNTFRLYLAVYSGIIGAVVGLSLLAMPLNNHIALKVLSLLLVIYHFVLRHLTTEPKGTPHLGQRGPDRQRKNEVWLGQLGDIYLVIILFVIWLLTKHPIWLLGTAILLAGYILGVWVHRRWDPKPREVSSYLGTLGCLIIMSVAVLVFGFEAKIPNLLRETSFALAIIGLIAYLDVKRYVAAIIVIFGLCLGSAS